MDKDMKKVVKALEQQGFEVRTTKKMHIVVYRDGRFVCAFAGTPSDWRGLKNGIAAARRAGFRWPP
ncbi:hypothetical protein [Nocardioides sp. Arc9.136]|uniref:hypothetical protein n=1 Tax=Nocardioides sp. Arc9.136 TaxID=2996826 RepID=UPI0026652590|nr:hypothetical protein [Nocardioides sp. Arc9.136]WKN47169.1 hypothetical protein OSR43_14085 [Nocardioides sp. Arc9.136]